MGQEIERKFLVKDDGWKPAPKSRTMRQGYLALGPPASVRVRIADGRADINIKRSTLEISREEFEFPIPVGEAEELLDKLCEGRVVEKVRHYIEYGGLTWEVDVFGGQNAGLVMAEVELEDEQQDIEIPTWAGKEVSGDPRYLNSNLAQHPYGEWNKAGA